MYKQLLLVSALSFGLAVAPSAMAKPKDEVRYPAGHDRGHVVDHRDTRNDDHRDNRRDGHQDNRREDQHDSRRDGQHDNRRDDHSDNRRDDDRDNRHDRGDRHDNRRETNDRRHDAHHRQWHDTRYRVAPYHAPRGYYHRAWHRGERLPSGYRGSRYVVHDYRSYHLHNPPRGHHWVRVDNDVVLTAIGTGLVAAVIYNIFM